MSSTKLLTAVIVSCMALSSVTFASFQSDYNSFIKKFGTTLPSWDAAQHNMREGDLGIRFEDDDGVQGSGMLQFQAAVIESHKDAQIRIKVDGSITDSGTTTDAVIDTEFMITSPSANPSQSDLYFKIHQLDAPVLTEDSSFSEMLTMLGTGWYVQTGINTAFGLGDLESSLQIVNQSEAKLQLYTQLAASPLITPINSAAAPVNGVYQVKLHKTNVARLVTKLAALQDPTLTLQTRNDITRQTYAELSRWPYKGTFDTTSNTITLRSTSIVVDEPSVSFVTVSPGELTVINKNSFRSEGLQASRDQNMIQGEYLLADDMSNTTQASFKLTKDSLTGSLQVSDDESDLWINFKVRSYRDDDMTIKAPVDAVPMSELF